MKKTLEAIHGALDKLVALIHWMAGLLPLSLIHISRPSHSPRCLPARGRAIPPVRPRQ